MAGWAGRKSRSLPRGVVARPRGAFGPGEGHLPFLGGMFAVNSVQTPEVGKVASGLGLNFVGTKSRTHHGSATERNSKLACLSENNESCGVRFLGW